MSDKEVKASAVKPEIITLSDNILKGFDVDSKTGKTKVEENLYVTNMPEGLNEDIATKLSQYNTDFVAAGLRALGMAGLKAMEKNKSLEEVDAVVPTVDRGNISFHMLREKITNKPRTAEQAGQPIKPEDQVKSYGVVTATIETRSSNAKAGQYKVVRDEMKALALAALSK